MPNLGSWCPADGAGAGEFDPTPPRDVGTTEDLTVRDLCPFDILPVSPMAYPFNMLQYFPLVGVLVTLSFCGSAQDVDRDGIPDISDDCPRDAEDSDEFEDEDGCPEVDNDRDGILDEDDRCPSVPELNDGCEYRDGCPGSHCYPCPIGDADGDEIIDMSDP